jgi:hypothetical protein
MTSLSGEFSQLAPLQTFDPQAFVGDSTVPQDICNFVLALALIYNDCKNGIFSNMLLTESKPAGKSQLSKSWGAFNGIKIHYFRLHFALIHELLNLIEDNAAIIKHPFFVSVTKLLSPPVRHSWQALVDASLQKSTSSTLNKFLLRIRNKVSFHYDPKELYRGYRWHFFRNTDPAEAAFVSRGASMRDSRFYFADAAADGYLQSLVENKNLDNLTNRLAEITADLNQTIMQIVDRFVQKRGYAYSEYKDQST